MRRAFTLIELLVVIAIIAVLAIVVVLTLNPAQLLAQSRDSNRLSDIASMNTALGVFQSDQPGGSLGSSNTVYPSIADSSATSTAGDQCQSLGLLSLPTAYSYHCAATSTLRSNTNTGWIPVNFASISAGSPLSQLPVDPTNTSSSRLYYTYTTNGNQFELTAAMESAKYKLGGSADVIGGDGGTLASVYEKGSKLGLEPLDYGDTNLVGYWTFDEGTGTVLYDYSGTNATGSWAGSGPYYTSNSKVGGYAGTFTTAALDYATPRDASSQDPTAAITVSAWINPQNVTSTNSDTFIVMKGSYGYGITRDERNGINSQAWTYINGGGNNLTASPLQFGAWNHIAYTYDGTTWIRYLNGVAGTRSFSSPISASGLLFIGGSGAIGSQFNGSIDDVRIYGRALSAAEIQAMYNAGK